MTLMFAVLSIAFCCATALARCDHDQCERAFRSTWANTSVKMECEKLIESLEVGDLIECETRENYKLMKVLGEEIYHWKIVTRVNEGDVSIHHVIGEKLDEMSVKKELLHTTMRNYVRCRRNNEKDDDWMPINATETLKCVDFLEGKWSYNILLRNCEHFVNFCRYKQFESMQPAKVVKAVATGSVVASATGCAIGGSASAVGVVGPAQAAVVAAAAYSTALKWLGDQPKSAVIKFLADFFPTVQSSAFVS